jgi:Cof subfamily protein (haloacid dehalogenase superfamily)
MDIRLIACDLDGTLMGPELVFTPRVRDAICRACARGITVTLATGRGYPSTRGYACQLGIDAPLICYQGAQIRDPDGGTLYQTPLPRTHLPEVIAFCRERGCELALYCDDEIYQTTRMYDPDYYDRWFGLPMHFVEGEARLLDALPSAPIKFIVIAANEAEADRVEPDLVALLSGRLQVMRSHAWFIEGLAQGVSKGDALSRLARRLGVVREQTMALGDSDNDAALVAWAGLGVAVGNASPAVRAAADVFAPPQDEDGAAWAIERFALGEG